MLDPDTLAPNVQDGLGRLLTHLGDDASSLPDDLAGRVQRFGRIKGERGRGPVAEALGLQEAELAEFDRAVRDVERTFDRRDGSTPTERNAAIAAVRFLSWLEAIGRHAPSLAPDATVEAKVSEDLGRKQVRALELVVRSLITESYDDQEQLVARLREALSDKVVQRWLASADPGDVLSGCSFGELASLFVNKEEFQRYEKLYEDTPFLTLLKQRRKTLQAFLDDVRRVRNRIAHNKRVTPTQLTLLDLYYDEIVSPVQTAHDEGETGVDPSVFLEVGKEELDGYFENLREDVLQVQDDLRDFRSSVEEKLGVVAADTAEIKETARGLDRKVVGIGAGVLLLIAIGVFLAMQGGDTQEEATAAREASERTETEVARVADETAKVAETTERIADDVADTADAASESAEAAGVAAEEASEAAEATREAGERIEEAAATTETAATETAEAATATQEAATATQEAAEEVKETTERVAQTLEELRDGFQALVKQGGIIANATRPQEHYHNARVYEQRGDVGPAMRSYRSYFSFDDLVFVDPHLRFQSFLRLQNGAAGAREIYYELKKDATSPAFAFAWNLLLDGDSRTQGLEAFLAEHPDFAPAWYALSRDFSVARLGTQSLEDKRREKEALETFLALKEDEEFLRYYLDQAVAVEQVEDAQERLAALDVVSETVLENPVTAGGSRSAQGWNMTLSIADNVKEIFYRVGTEGPFKSTGFMEGYRTPQGNPLAQPFFDLPLKQPKTVVQVKYVDLRGREHGPYDVTFDPDEMLLASSRTALRSVKQSWLLFRPYDGKMLLYFSQLVNYHEVLKEIRYGLDTDVPNRTFPLVKADPSDPYRLGTIDMPFLEVPHSTKRASVQLVYVDGTESEIVVIER